MEHVAAYRSSAESTDDAGALDSGGDETSATRGEGADMAGAALDASSAPPSDGSDGQAAGRPPEDAAGAACAVSLYRPIGTPQVHLVVDASGSMAEDFDGQGLIAALRQVAGNALGCTAQLGADVSLDDPCEGVVELNGAQLECQGPDGWRLLDEHTLELTGAACAQLSGREPRLSARFSCSALSD
jgi:hypothetical protein